MNETVELALVQMACGRDAAANLRRAGELAREARQRGAEVVCLQELFTNIYFGAYVDSAYFRLAEPIPGPTSDALAALAKELEVVLVGSIYERVRDGLYFNTAVVFERDGTLLGKARKMHIPEAPLYTEKLYFAPGDTDYPVFRTSLIDLCVATCWDQWFPEVARIAMLKGAELMLYPTALAHDRERWQTVQRGHAVANAMYVAACNRVGPEEHHRFYGHSFVADPRGAIIAEADDSEQVLLATLERERLRATREDTPFCRDRRVETYAPLLQRTLAE